MTNAIEREKQIKAGSRAKKIALIEIDNPTWRDLYDNISNTSLRAKRGNPGPQAQIPDVKSPTHHIGKIEKPA